MKLKITDIKTVPLKVIKEVGVLEPAWDLGGEMVFQSGGGAYTEVHTDGGIVGIGPAVDPNII